MPDDQAQTILAPTQVDNGLKADAWEAFKGSANERELGAKLQGMNLPDKVKADLWEAKRGMGQPAGPNLKTGEGMEAQAQRQARQGTVNRGLASMTEPTTVHFPSMISGIPGQSATMPADEAYQTQKDLAEQGATGLALMGSGGVTGLVRGGGLLANILRIAGAGAGAVPGVALRQSLANPGTAPQAGEVAKESAFYSGGEALGLAVSPLVKWIGSSKALGAKLLQQASQKAGSAPIAISHNTDVLVDEIVQQSKLGGGPVPAPVTALLDRLGPSTRQAAEAAPGPLTYDEARILQGNASSLSAAEAMNLKGRMEYLVPQFAKSLANDVQQGANQAGIGELHAQGMKEYATASARNRTLVKVAKVAGIGTGIAAGEQLAKKAIKAATE